MSEPRLRFFDVPYTQAPAATHRMAVYEWGATESARVVFCVHGLTRNARDFDFLAAALAAGARVIAVDMPGRGRSEWLRDAGEYAMPSYLANLEFLWKVLGLSRVEWVGTSMGGWVGMFLAAERPERIAKLVMNDIGPYVSREALLRLGEYIGKSVHFATREEAEAKYRQIYAPFGIDSEEKWRHLLAHSFEPSADGGVRAAYDPAIGAAFAQPEKIQAVELWETWWKVKCPVLVLHGMESGILTAETAAQMQAVHPQTEVVNFPGIGHAPSLMRQEEISAVTEWLGK